MLNTPKKKKFNPMLMNVILISLGLHLVGLLILGGITVINHVIPDEAQFEEPPAVAEEAPPPEVKVKIPPPDTPKPQSMSKMSMRPLSNIAVANVAVDLPSMDQSFTVSTGLGSLGGGSLMGGAGGGSIGMGMSDVSVFGLKARAEKILFIIDAGKNMVFDEKGGLESYRVIKKEIADMVSNLSAGTLFNVMLYEDIGNNAFVRMFKPSLKPAGAAISDELRRWFEPVNTNADKPGIRHLGSPTALVTTKVAGFENYYAGMRQYPNYNAVAQQAMEMNVNAIFMITGQHKGFGQIRLALSAEQEAQRQANLDAFTKTPEYKAHRAEWPEMQKRIKEALAKENQRRAAKGQPPKVIRGGNPVRDAAEFGLAWKNPPPGSSGNIIMMADSNQTEKYFKAFCKEQFSKSGRQPPSTNVILFLAEDEELSKEQKNAIQKYTRYFKGKLKVIRGLSGITKSSSAKGTSN
jgi:hypothetical protein